MARASRTGNAVSTSVEQRIAQLEALKGGKGGKATGKGSFSGKCDNCGKPGHKKSDFFLKGGGAYKGKGGGKTGSPGAGKAGKEGKGISKQCYECGMTNHLAKDCRASEEKRKKYKESLRKGGPKNCRIMRQRA